VNSSILESIGAVLGRRVSRDIPAKRVLRQLDTERCDLLTAVRLPEKRCFYVHEPSSILFTSAF
jgi:hypothetical protein